MMRSIGIALLGALGVCLTACSSVSPQQSAAAPRLPNPGPDAEYTVEWPDGSLPQTRLVRMTVGAGPGQCDLTHAHFEFDSSEPLPQDHLVLIALAECLREPALEGHQIRIIGRADPQGQPLYNDRLGRLRAERAKEILVEHGVPAERITTSSRGEREAKLGDPLYAFGFDRRVDVVLRVVRAPAGVSGPAYVP